MAALDFPTSPLVNDLYTADDGTQWKWDGTTWNENTSTNTTNNFRFLVEEVDSISLDTGATLNLKHENAQQSDYYVFLNETSTDGVFLKYETEAYVFSAANPQSQYGGSLKIANYSGTGDPLYSHYTNQRNINLSFFDRMRCIYIGRETGYYKKIQNPPGNFYSYQNYFLGCRAAATNKDPLDRTYSSLGCIAIGYEAGANKNTISNFGDVGDRWIVIGSKAGSNSSNETNIPSVNTIIGYSAAIDWKATNNTDGNKCVAVGANSGAGLEQYSTSTEQLCSFLGENSGYNATPQQVQNVTCIGHDSPLSSNNNEITLGDSNIATLRCNVQTISALSDARDKKNIQDLSIGLNYIKDLNPVEFDWDRREGNGDITGHDCGFTAQELQQSEEKFDVKWLNTVTEDKSRDLLHASYERLLPVMVKAIQELISEIKQLEESYSV